MAGNGPTYPPRVFVLARHGKPLMPCHPYRARELIRKGRAVVHGYEPYTIRLLDREDGVVQPIDLKIDPGSKTTGVALARVAGGVAFALFLFEITHRGLAIRAALHQRACYRRRRRGANLRYRKPRFDNRTKPAGWLPSSLRHRVDTVLAWVRKVVAVCPVSQISIESVRFDMQRLVDAEIVGVEYQHGTLYACELREYVLEKWGRACVYCGAKDVPLQNDHVVARARGGSSRPDDFVPACERCNQAKGSRPIEEFLAGKLALLARILASLKRPLRDAAAVNATRFAIVRELKKLGLPVRTGSGGRTKWNRSRFGVPKEHALDALCACETEGVHGWQGMSTYMVGCVGRGTRQRVLMTASGFPRMRARQPVDGNDAEA
jgi:5-methylcytosine-specific restriction endonuclease McrA